MGVETPLQLYRHLLKCVKKLPNDSQGYYKHYIRQGFRTHADEKDSERIRQIITRAVEDAEWIIRKLFTYTRAIFKKPLLSRRQQDL